MTPILTGLKRSGLRFQNTVVQVVIMTGTQMLQVLLAGLKRSGLRFQNTVVQVVIMTGAQMLQIYCSNCLRTYNYR